MLQKYTIEEYSTLYDSLSEKNRELFWNNDISSRIRKIEEDFTLTEKQGDAITLITAHLFLGILPPIKLEKVIRDELKINDSTSEKITDTFFRTLVFPVQLSLKNLYEDSDFRRTDKETPLQRAEREKANNINDLYREPIE
jgi:hypothetical protein